MEKSDKRTPSSEKGIDRRARILHEALLLFSEKGIDGTGLRDIAARVGITQPTLYHYFASKEDLIQALIDHHDEIARQTQLEAMSHFSSGPSLRQGLTRVAENILEMWNNPTNQAFQRVLMSELARGGPLAERLERNFIRPRRDMAARMFAGLIAAGKVRDLDPDLLALQFMGPMIFAGMLRNAGHDSTLSKERIRELLFQHLETFIRGIERI